ncbi:MAG: Calx-beta domain-containing protein, partial [Methylococcales bacterium]|nr:Calx-beta domain-containing protein [Methylococcales bacterium]
LAIIKLAQPLAQTSGYEIYRAKTEIGQTFTRVGFSGTDLVAGKNTYDALTDVINSSFGSHVEADSQLLYDYDDGSTQHDALGLLFNVHNLGLGNDETMSQSGLSGGGTFIDGKIAGIGSFIFRSDLSDINGVIDSSFGEMGSDTRISTHADWIDFITQGNPVYTAPTTASEVIKSVPEPNFGSVVNYFLASFSEPLTQDISFHFRTIDGTAIAGLDYLATQGQMTLRVGENHIAIPVTILGDKTIETDETFSLEISEPVGFSFPNNVLVLTATHTIIDNDRLIF